MKVRFTWNEQKSERNRRERKFDFEIASRVFADPDALFEEDRIVDGEERLHVIGMAKKSALSW